MGNRFLPLILCGVGLAFTCFATVSDHPLIFPRPQELEILDGQLPLGDQSVIALPVDATQSDLFLARFLVEELADRWGVTVAVQHVATLPTNKPVILMGSM